MNAADRRHSKRVDVARPATLEPLEARAVRRQAQVVDLSARGLCVRTDRPEVIGTRVRVEVMSRQDLPALAAIEQNGRVVRVSPSERDKGYELGIELESPAYRAPIRKPTQPPRPAAREVRTVSVPTETLKPSPIRGKRRIPLWPFVTALLLLLLLLGGVALRGAVDAISRVANAKPTSPSLAETEASPQMRGIDTPALPALTPVELVMPARLEIERSANASARELGKPRRNSERAQSRELGASGSARDGSGSELGASTKPRENNARSRSASPPLARQEPSEPAIADTFAPNVSAQADASDDAPDTPQSTSGDGGDSSRTPGSPSAQVATIEQTSEDAFHELTALLGQLDDMARAERRRAKPSAARVVQASNATPSITQLPATNAANALAITVDISRRQLTVSVNSKPVRTFAIGVGANDSTPEGTFAVANKISDPDWYNHGNVVKAGDPANPLGKHWIGLGDDDGPMPIGIHATPDIESIGDSASRGCVRMQPADAEALFRITPVGTPVIIQP